MPGRSYAKNIYESMDAGDVTESCVKKNVRPDRLIRYLDRFVGPRCGGMGVYTIGCAYQDWKDYVVMAEKLGYDLTVETVLMPRNLDLAHQQAQEEMYLKMKREERKKNRAERKAAKESLARRQKRYNIEHDGYFIRIAVSSGEIIAEGKALEHCVGGYAERHMSDKTTILFLRSSDAPDKPLYLEVCGAFRFDLFTRVEGSGEKIRVADGGRAYFGNGGEPVFVVYAAENLGNLDIPALAKRNLTVPPDEHTLFAAAVHVSSFDELLAASKQRVPIVLDADVTFPEQVTEELWVRSPLLIPEGVTLSKLQPDFSGSTDIHLNDGALTNYGKLVVEGNGNLRNLGYIHNYGSVHLEARSYMENAQLENDGSFSVAYGAVINAQGSAFYGGGDFDISSDSAGHTVYRWVWGNSVTVTTEQELRAALDNASVTCIHLQGEVNVGSDLRVSKNVDVVGRLVMAEGTALSVDSACIHVSNGVANSRVIADRLTLSDRAIVWLESPGCDLELRNGGALDMTHSFVGGNGSLLPGSNAAVTLLDESAIALRQEQEFSNLSLTLESGSTFSCSGTLHVGDTGGGTKITVDGGCLDFIGDTRLTGCNVALKNGGVIRTAVDGLELADCTVTIGENCTYWSMNTSLTLSRATTWENRGTMETHGWDNMQLNIADAAKLVNNGSWKFAHSSLSGVRGTIENHGSLDVYSGNVTDAELARIQGVPPVRKSY